MLTICWEGHRFEYLQDQTVCNEPGCGETSQHRPRRFGTGERETLNEKIKAAQSVMNEGQKTAIYSRGYAEGFEAGILAEEKRIKV